MARRGFVVDFDEAFVHILATVDGVLGQYQIVKKLGEGGMGAVYLAEHTLLGRRAAVKVLQPALSANQDIVQRFFNEARAATAIADPGIVQIFDFGYHTDGSAFIVMEFLEGEPLDARLRRQSRLTPEEALRVLRQVASSLHAAHSRGIIHRDLKPENIYLVPDREVAGGERAKILDFGIAKLSNDVGSKVKTHTAAIMGTPMYMSPEQCRGAGHVDHRSDLYALGCVLYHLVVGRVPFDGEGVGEIIAAHMMMPPPIPSQQVPGIPPAIDQLIARLLQKRPEDRFADARELADACGAILGGATPPPGALSGNYAAATVMAPSVPPGSITGTPSLTTLSGSAGGAPAAGTVAAPPRKRGLGLAIGAIGVVGAGVAAVVVLGGGGGGGDTSPATGSAVAPVAKAPESTPPPEVPPPAPTPPPVEAKAPALPALPDTASIAVVFAIDNSGAMAGSHKHVMAAVDVAALELPDDAVVGLVHFDRTATIDLPLAPLDRNMLGAAVGALRPGGAHDLAAGLASARDVISRAPAKATRHVFVIAGGKLAPDGIDAAAQALVADRVTVSTFAIDGADRAVLKQLAETSGGKAYDRLRGSDLAKAFGREVERLQGEDKPVARGTKPGAGSARPGKPPGDGMGPLVGPLPDDPPPPLKSKCPNPVPGDTDCDGIPDER